jgi:hypothetical protein
MIIPDEVKRLTCAGKDKKLDAIQALRRATGMDLALAKEVVETIAAGGEVQLATPPPAPPNEEAHEQHIQRQLKAIGRTESANVLNNEEIGRLLEILQVEEDLLDIAHGSYGNCSGVLVATQSRLLFMNREIIDAPHVEEFPLDSIYLVHHKAGLHGSAYSSVPVESTSTAAV